ncbi:MAG: cell division protein FtsA [Ignavibacteria bacterium]|jgi:cell division protein FtsA|nr:cell division protein FtsA [Ignavibacteria bacterium]
MGVSTNQKIAVGLDIGTTKVCAIILTEGEKNDNYKILGCSTTKNTGVNRGVIANIEKTVEAINKVVKEVQQQSGITFTDVVVGIAGDHIESASEVSTITINNPNQIVSQVDVDRVTEELRKSKISNDREIIHIVPYEYLIDGQGGITQPIGMCGVRMQANVHIVTGVKTAIQNIYRCVDNNAGLKVRNIVLEPIASSLALLNDDEKEVGVCLIDIGGGTTDITIFKDDVLRYTSIVAIGGNKITDDVRAGFRTTKDEAERIKCSYGHTFMPSIMKKDDTFMIRGVGGYPPQEPTKDQLCNIIQPRVEEIFEMCYGEILKSGFANELGAGVVITGGAALLKGTDELASRIFNSPVRIGYPSGENYVGLSTEIESPIYSTAVGLALYALKENSSKTKQTAAAKEADAIAPVTPTNEAADATPKEEVEKKVKLSKKLKDFLTNL